MLRHMGDDVRFPPLSSMLTDSLKVEHQVDRFRRTLLTSPHLQEYSEDEIQRLRGDWELTLPCF